MNHLFKAIFYFKPPKEQLANLPKFNAENRMTTLEKVRIFGIALTKMNEPSRSLHHQVLINNFVVVALI
jgi:hypothetical protein